MTVTWKFPIPLPDGKGMEVENGNRVKKKNKRVKTFNGNERKVKGKRKKEVDMKE